LHFKISPHPQHHLASQKRKCAEIIKDPMLKSLSGIIFSMIRTVFYCLLSTFQKSQKGVEGWERERKDFAFLLINLLV